MRFSFKNLKHFKSSILFFSVFAIFLFLSYKIISPYLVAIISAFILSYLIRPIYLFLNHYFNKSVSAIISISFLAIFIFIPSYFLVGRIYSESKNFIFSPQIKFFVSKLSSDSIFYGLDVSSFLNPIFIKFSTYFGNLLSKVPSILLAFLVALFGIYYILVYWDLLTNKLEKYIPAKNKVKKIEDIKRKTNAILYGTLLIGIIQGIFSFVCFYFLGISNSIIFSIFIFLASIVPGIGPGAIWMPLSLYYFLIGNNFVGFGIIFSGVIVSYILGLFLTSKILGGNAKINPFIMLVGILGGIGVFGIFGFIIGPLVLVYTIELLDGIFND